MLCLLLLTLLAVCLLSVAPDISTAPPPDLVVPPMIPEAPAPGKRVKQYLSALRGSTLYHVLYLPPDWQPGCQYPVIVEYPGNGPYQNAYGDSSSGEVESCVLGYGVTGGSGAIWVSLPFVDPLACCHVRQWWGDVEATVAYCQVTLELIFSTYGGDPARCLLAGFSRGAIACNYIGLHDDTIAARWCAFIAHSHYDGVQSWGYVDDDSAAASIRLQRLQGRPQFISNEEDGEHSVERTWQYLHNTGIQAPFTFLSLPYRNHCSDWVLRPLPERAQLRDWYHQVIDR